jgi:hypothetical protein
MDPIIRHRLVLLACIIACCAVLAPFANDFLPADRSAGFTLIFAHVGPLHAFIEFAALLVPLTCIALIASVSGTALSGAFVLGVTLCIFAAGFGPANGLLLRANLPHDYSLLAIESAVLACLALAVGAVLKFATRPLKPRLPWLTRFADEPPHSEVTTPASTCAAVAITVPIAGLIAYFLAIGDSPKQAIGTLIAAFTLAAGFSCNMIGRRAMLGSLLSPFILAVIAYAFPLLAPMGSHAFTRLWFTNELSGLCRILPIYYLAAGAVGTVIGIVVGLPATAEPEADAKPS